MAVTQAPSTGAPVRASVTWPEIELSPAAAAGVGAAGDSAAAAAVGVRPPTSRRTAMHIMAMRQRFLFQVPLHRAIVEAATRHGLSLPAS